jgi:mono/diheme cytochrome c family protein
MISNHSFCRSKLRRRLGMPPAGLALAGALSVLMGASERPGQPVQPEPWIAPARPAKKPNPIKPDSASFDAGKRIYERECLSCHGAKGAGDGAKAPDLERKPGNLAAPEMWEQSDGALFWKISEGRAPMPATKTLISDDERWHVINFVRTLAPPNSAPTPPQYAMPEVYRKAISAAIKAYGPLRAALAGKGDGAAASKVVPALADALANLSKTDDAAASDAAKSAWREDAGACATAAEALKSAGEDVTKLRQAFATLSTSLIHAIDRYGHMEAGPVSIFAETPANAPLWIQTDAKAQDPYGAGAETQAPKRRLAAQQRP